MIPLGGLGEIGMNCLALEHAGRRVVIDCGLTFDDRGLGIDVIHPDLSFLRDAPERLEAIVVTHGHEDHVGAVPYLLEACPGTPVYAPPYALGVLRERLSQHPAASTKSDLHAIRPKDRIALGPFEIEPYRVTHSMPDCTGLIVRTEQGVLVHSGDFKIEDAPTDGEGWDWDRLEALREEGVRVLLSDSTNAMVEGSTGPEHEVADRLEEIVAAAPQRVVVTLFASNVHRLRALAEIAKKTGRKLVLLGRSLRMHAKIGQAEGYLPGLEAVEIAPEMARKVPRHQLLVLATGTQGEPPAALARLARGNHPDLDLSAGDVVVHSARIIPGCETRVYPVFDELARAGVEVLWKRLDPSVHVSGHAHRGEQRRLIEALRPASFIPLHGTHMHMTKHAELARECGVEDVLVIGNGDVVEVNGGPLAVQGRVPTGRVYRERGKELDPRVLRDRELLASLGFAVISAWVDDAGRPVAPLDLLTRGVLHEDENPDLLDDACDSVHRALVRARYTAERPDLDDVEAVAKRALKHFFSKRLLKKPLCYAMVSRRP
ncbi:MAG: ribonuclease J [Sandaracinaceae bacterium]|nr:ribonuclease J [Sandaracinaceae bacterium]